MLQSNLDHTITWAFGFAPSLGNAALQERQGLADGKSPREGLGNLLRDPFGRRVCCDVDADKLSAGQPDDDQNIE